MKAKKETAMFEHGNNVFRNLLPPVESSPGQLHAWRYHTAIKRFKTALFKSQFMRLVKRVLRSRTSLYDLNVLRPQLALHGSHYAGVKAIEIRSIIGSEGRTADFDPDFCPVSEKSRERWVNVALTFLTGLPLKPVELIQVGDAYFVRDGHHRISVARAFGQMAIDAEVVSWKVQPPFPWERTLDVQPRSLRDLKLST
jgi:hypothetical protein